MRASLSQCTEAASATTSLVPRWPWKPDGSLRRRETTCRGRQDQMERQQTPPCVVIRPAENDSCALLVRGPGFESPRRLVRNACKSSARRPEGEGESGGHGPRWQQSGNTAPANRAAGGREASWWRGAGRGPSGVAVVEPANGSLWAVEGERRKAAKRLYSVAFRRIQGSQRAASALGAARPPIDATSPASP
jgi:hypothetical protein